MKRAVAGISAGLLVLSGIAAVATTATADEDFTFVRLAGPDRYGTAADIATKTFQTSDRVLLAAGGQRNFPDALAGNYLAGALDAPLLLTANNSLPQFTRDALTRLQAKTVTILGGTSAVSANVESQLKTAGYTVERISGVDRYATAREVAETPSATGIGTVGTAGRTAILASGQNFPDALAAGPLGYARNLPILITTPGSLSSATRATIESLDIENVIVAGGSTAVSENTENQVKALNGGITTTRLAGSGTQSTRQGTAVAIADFAIDNLGFSNAHVDLARGDDFADALAGGPHSGVNNAPILLTDSANALGVAARDFLRANCQTLTEGHIFGGTAAVSDAVMTAANEAARCGGVTPSPTATATPTSSATPTASTSPSPSPTTAPTTNQDFAVTPNQEAINTVSTATGANANRGQRTYTVNVGTQTVDIGLIPTQNVTTATNGNVTFADVDTNENRADALGNTQSVIESVNGVGINASDFVENVVGGTNGVITFTVDSTVANQSVIPVILVDSDNNNQLNLDAANQPTELFAIGGSKLFVPEESVFGNFTNREAIIVRQDQDFFTTNDALFNYDTGDQFRYSSGNNDAIISFADFERFLSGRFSNLTGAEAGDFLQISYNPDPAAASTFEILIDTPLAPTNVTATVTNANPGTGNGQDSLNDDIIVRFTASVSPDTDGGYDIFRRTINADGTRTAFEPRGSVVDGTTQFNDQNVSPETGSTTFEYVVLARNSEGDQSPNSNIASVTIAAITPAERPVSTATNFSNGQTQVDQEDNPSATQGDLNTLDRGDSLDITFEQVGTGLVLNNPTLTVRDADGTTVTLNTSNAQFTLGTATDGEQVLSIVLTSTPVASANGSDTAFNVNDVAAIISSTGISNAAGPYNLAASGCAFDCDRFDFTDVTRVFSNITFIEQFGNAFLPDAVEPEDVVVDTANNRITVQGDADDFSEEDEGDRSDIDPGESFSIFDAQGNVIATGTFNGAGTTVTTTTDIAPGDDLFLVFTNRGGTGQAFDRLPSATTELINPSDIPTVTDVERGTANNQLLVTFEDDDVTATQRITQVGPAANYQVFDANNNTLIATGVATAPAQGGQAPCDAETFECTVTVTLDRALTQDVDYILRVAPNTVQDPNNTPNIAQTVPFDIEGQDPTIDNVMVDGTTGGVTTDATPTVTGTANDVDGTITNVAFSTDGETFAPATPTDGAFNESSEGFTFTTATLEEGDNQIVIRATDNEGNEGFEVVTVTVNAQNPTITAAEAQPASDDFPNGSILVTFSEDVVCATGENDDAEAASFIYDDQSVGPNSDGSPTTVTEAGPNQCRLSGFPNGIQNNDFGLLDFAQPGDSTQRISDAEGGQLQSQNDVEVEDVTSVVLTDAAQGPTANAATLTFSEPVDCDTVQPGDFVVTVDGGQRTITADDCATGTVDNQFNVTFSGEALRNNAVVVVRLLEDVLTDEFGRLNDASQDTFTVSDADADGFAAANDNCDNVANPGQEDLDADGLGDACDDNIDGDSQPNSTDAFPTNPNETVDTDNDGIGNNADTDDDGDGFSDAAEIAAGSNPLDPASTPV